jgi:hypothetical protein
MGGVTNWVVMVCVGDEVEDRNIMAQMGNGNYEVR